MSHRSNIGVLMLLVCVAAGLGGSCAERKYKTRLSNTPPALLQLDQGAQAIITAAPLARWPQIYRHVQTMENAWQDYKHPTVVAGDESRQPWERDLRSEVDSAMARLREAAAARDATATTKAAQDVDSAVLSLFEFYETAVTQNISAPRTE